MSFKEIIKRELEVAFSKHSQPVWFRILKYVLLIAMIYFLWGNKLLWIILLVVIICSLSLHFWYRHKTNGWAKSYGMWKHKGKDQGSEKIPE